MGMFLYHKEIKYKRFKDYYYIKNVSNNNMKKKRYIVLLLISLLVPSCKPEMEKNQMDFCLKSEERLESRWRKFKLESILNPNRFKKYFDDFNTYYEKSIEVKDELKGFIYTKNNSRLNSSISELDSLLGIVKRVYLRLGDTIWSSSSKTETQFTYIESLFTSMKDKISTCKSPNDMLAVYFMLEKVDLEVYMYLYSKPTYGLNRITDFRGPVIVTDKDSVFFHLTAYDSTRPNILIIGNYESHVGPQGSYYEPLGKTERIYLEGFLTGLPKSKLIGKEILYVTVTISGDTIMSKIR